MVVPLFSCKSQSAQANLAFGFRHSYKAKNNRFLDKQQQLKF